MNYRNEARLRLDAAKNELTSGDDARLKYAALELRMSMEALTYDRALAFKDEFPPAEYQTWQPKKVMLVLLEIHPSADADRALAIGGPAEEGVPASIMHSLGTERVLNMRALKKHYDALGSYLHLPSMKQTIEGRTVDSAKLRKRCEELAALIDDVLSSRIFNVTLGVFSTMNCFRCERPIRKRVQDEQEAVAECFDCHATYSLVPVENGQIEWHPKGRDVACPREGCAGRIFVWEADQQVGKHWECNTCGGRNALVLAVHQEAASPSGQVAE
ncbi:MAG: hypothetical protein KY467_08460 [Gemmatimonadetes bacterium]|nr:hypothetical protein [Gemmatimonadota bacterium]